MNIHNNARLTPRGRDRIVLEVLSGQMPEAAARAAGVCPQTVRKWHKRYLAEGPAGLYDRSSWPHRLYRPTPQPTVERIAHLRHQRWTGKQIAVEVGVSPATVSRILKRLGINKLKSLEPAGPVRRYERDHLPTHLPRVERVIEPASTLFPCGCGKMARIGEDVSECLDVIPAQLRVLVTPPPEICLPPVFQRGGAGPCPGTCGAGRAAERGADCP